MLFLPQSISRLANAAAKEQERYSMHGIHLRQEPHGGFRAEATNGKIAMIVQEGPWTTPEHEELAVQRMQALCGNLPEGFATEALIPAKIFQDAFKGLKKTDDAHDRLWIYLGEKEAVMSFVSKREAPGPVFRTPYIEGRFPNIDGVVPTKPPTAMFNLNVDLAISLLQGMKPMLDDSGKVTICLYGSLLAEQDSCIALTAKTEKGLFLDALAMPITTEKK